VRVEFDGRSFAKNLADSPGVYRMLDVAGELLYVGKAKSLRNRVSSYFSKNLSYRISRMVRLIASIEVTLTRTEAEALLLENQLIKTLRPRFNIDLRDDKSYPYVRLVKKHAFPRLSFFRGQQAHQRGDLRSAESALRLADPAASKPKPKKADETLFGPFPSAHAVRQALDLMSKLFQLRSCEDSVFANRSRPCLQYQIQRCSAPCVGLIDAESYARDLEYATWFLSGKSMEVVERLGNSMEQAAEALDFERAAKLRDQIAYLKSLQAKSYVSGGEGNADVIGLYRAAGEAAITVLLIRGGMQIGSRNILPKVDADTLDEELIARVLAENYIDAEVPEQILLSHPFSEAELYQQALSVQSGRSIAIRSELRGERAGWIRLAVQNATAALEQKQTAKAAFAAKLDAITSLFGLAAPPNRIECFDISHSKGEGTMASCVVFDADGAKKSDYRRFGIEGITPGDDYAAIEQAVRRRFQRLKQNEAPMPDLLLIDGGPNQLERALIALRELDIQLPCVAAMAKGAERKAGFEVLHRDGLPPLFPGPESLASHGLQQVRDEAHRFALTGHRARRAKAREASALDTIDGIGAVRKRALLKHFGGMRGLKRAGVDELKNAPGISQELALRIYSAMHGC
jgi:excinuclease ABC subunit C